MQESCHFGLKTGRWRVWADIGMGLAWGLRLRPESARGVQLLYNVHAIDSPIDVKLLAVGKAIAMLCCNLLMHKGVSVKTILELLAAVILGLVLLAAVNSISLKQSTVYAVITLQSVK